MKKFVACYLVLVLCAVMIGFTGTFAEQSETPAGLEKYTCGPYTYRIREDGSAAIIEYSGTETEIDIPAELDGHPVTGVMYAFGVNVPGLARVTVPEGVTDIGSSFAFGRNLKEIHLPETLTDITGAFAACSALEKVNLPKGLAMIGDRAFNSCISLKEIGLPDGITEIGIGAFAGCHSLETISLPSGVVRIDDEAFARCTALTEVRFAAYPPYLSIGNSAFAGCESLQEFTVPARMFSVGEQAFDGCKALKAVQVVDTPLPEDMAQPGVVVGLTEMYRAPMIRFLSRLYAWQQGYTVRITGEEWREKKLQNIQANIDARIEEIEAKKAEISQPDIAEGKKAAFERMIETKTAEISELEAELEKVQTLHILSDDDAVAMWKEATGIEGGAADGTDLYQYWQEQYMPLADEQNPIGGFNNGVQLITSEDGLGWMTSDMNTFKQITAGFRTEADGTVAFYGLFEPGIGQQAFSGCENLETLRIPAAVDTIGKEVFTGCGRLTVTVAPGSTAEQYCMDHNIPYTAE